MKVFPQWDSLCLLLGSRGYLWSFPRCYGPPKVAHSAIQPDCRRNDKAISCLHLGMILQNLTLVLRSVQLCVLFSWICWCFIYVGHAGSCTGLVRAVCALAGVFRSATFVSHICYTMKSWSEEVQGNVTLWWVRSSGCALPSSGRNITLNWFVICKTTILINISLGGTTSFYMTLVISADSKPDMNSFLDFYLFF